MTWSGKAADLRQDPRYVLHSVVSGPDSGQGELKLCGLAVEADPGLRGADEAWWSAHPPGKAVVFSLRIGQAMFVAWDIDHGVMTVHQWSPRRGYSHRWRLAASEATNWATRPHPHEPAGMQPALEFSRATPRDDHGARHRRAG
jgi:hypothetical protein